MKVRIITPGTAASARLTAIQSATLAILASALICACTSSPGKTAPAIYTPPTSTRTHTGTTSASPATTARQSAKASAPASTRRASATSTAKASPTSTAPATASPKVTTAPAHPSHTPARAVTSHTPAPADTRVPAGAPATGGGGTAGLQDGMLFGLGGAAMLAGLGTLGYRRRLTRNR
jgi:hypothetical protein